ncbi:hypothetical protein A5868_001360 [Enterococcus sp. 12F9_DIV0723]|uniref:PTS lactose/cellobiose transporter subunit IIA n=1 Tax=Enterococcus sp. 12F9_DIV0723 TaxID=1834169 RepID=UPI000B3EB561|nr:PTS lactose/cellobiose transporter subunit IIA [Enterococcus sp. 12F9_DIV0723]OUZ16439.1 hypothetical protein A5868_001360 [Enterococcus sp. 12F9_DIV0723]
MDKEVISEEQVIMGIIINGGDARSKAIKAIQKAKSSDFEIANELLKECKESLCKAHNVQTELIQEEIRRTDKSNICLLYTSRCV